jgi:hypothetical protein
MTHLQVDRASIRAPSIRASRDTGARSRIVLRRNLAEDDGVIANGSYNSDRSDVVKI